MKTQLGNCLIPCSNIYIADPCGHAVCGRSTAGIAVSDPPEGMDIRLLYLLDFV